MMLGVPVALAVVTLRGRFFVAMVVADGGLDCKALADAEISRQWVGEGDEERGGEQWQVAYT